MHTGRFWDPETRAHTSGEGPGDRAYSAVPVDFDADGDIDLLVGTDKGHVFLRRNVGTKTKPSFDVKLEPLEGTGTAPYFLEGYAMPVVVDWDGDGLFDLVSGGKKGGVFWLRNAGTSSAPKFEPQRAILEEGATSDEGIGGRTQIEVADFDGDGDLDILVGDYESTRVENESTRRANVWLYLRKGAPAAKPVEASAKGND